MTLAATFAAEPDFITLALLGVTFINGGLALIVVRAARREENRVFALVALSVALWTLTNALFRTASTLEAATLWAQMSYFAALSTAATFLHLSWIYPRRVHAHWRAALSDKAALYAMGLLVAVYAALPGFVIRGIDLESRRILTGPGLWIVALFMVATSALSFYLLVNHQNHRRGRSRAQARYVLYGSALTALFGLTFNLGFPLAGDYRFVWLGPMASLFFVGFSGYSIVAHHLFDVRLLIRRTLVYTILLAGLAGAFAALEKGLEYALRPLLGGGSGFSTDLLAALVVGFGVDPLKRRLHRIAAKALFRDEVPDGDEND